MKINLLPSCKASTNQCDKTYIYIYMYIIYLRLNNYLLFIFSFVVPEH